MLPGRQRPSTTTRAAIIPVLEQKIEILHPICPFVQHYPPVLTQQFTCDAVTDCLSLGCQCYVSDLSVVNRKYSWLRDDKELFFSIPSSL